MRQDPIANGIALVFHATNWADRQEELGNTFPGQEITDICGEPSDDALAEAWRTVGKIERLNGMNVHALAWKAIQADQLTRDVYQTETPTADELSEFGWYLGMQSLGHGVGWFDDHAEFDLNLPLVEFHEEIDAAA